MVDPKKLDFNQMPKKFCDGAVGAFNKNIFYFAVTSGNSLDVFATTPQVMKDIAKFISAHVENYEKQFGEIDMTVPLIKSPIQVAESGENK